MILNDLRDNSQPAPKGEGIRLSNWGKEPQSDVRELEAPCFIEDPAEI